MREHELHIMDGQRWVAYEGSPAKIRKKMDGSPTITIWEGDASELGAEVEALRRHVNLLRDGITQFDIRLLCGCKLANNDQGEWWLHGENGEALLGGTGSIEDIIMELS